MEFNTETFTLRPWQKGDETSLAEQANNYKIWINLRDIFPHPYTIQDAQQWVNITGSIPNTLNLAIVIDRAAVGGIGLVFKDDVYRRSAEIGYWLGEPYWGKGIITKAVRHLTQYAFQHFGICRIFAGIFEYNKASMRVLEKAGYTLEAIHRQAITKKDQTYDEYLYVILK